MHGRPVHQVLGETTASHPNRWRILGVLVLALLVTSIDHTIINVALPRLVGDLGASSAQLQWIVAAYTIVFAGLLLTAGSLGDRFGRRHALLAGLATFLGRLRSSPPLAGSTTALIAGRCVMGVGGALIMPTTLSILVNVFGDPRERAKAIAGWTAASGAGIALGPIVGGALMRSFSWSSVFWINVPLLVAALRRGAAPRPRLPRPARDPARSRSAPACRSPRSARSSTPSSRHPSSGWTSTAVAVNFAVGAAIAVAVRRLGDAPRRPDARHAAVPQPQLLRRQHRPRPAVLRHGRHRVPAGAVPAVRARLHPARRRVRPRPGRDRDAARHRRRRSPRRQARRAHRRDHRHADRRRRRRRAGRASSTARRTPRPVSGCCCSASAPASRCPPRPT